MNIVVPHEVSKISLLRRTSLSEPIYQQKGKDMEFSLNYYSLAAVKPGRKLQGTRNSLIFSSMISYFLYDNFLLEVVNALIIYLEESLLSGMKDYFNKQ